MMKAFFEPMELGYFLIVLGFNMISLALVPPRKQFIG